MADTIEEQTKLLAEASKALAKWLYELATYN